METPMWYMCRLNRHLMMPNVAVAVGSGSRIRCCALVSKLHTCIHTVYAVQRSSLCPVFVSQLRNIFDPLYIEEALSEYIHIYIFFFMHFISYLNCNGHSKQSKWKFAKPASSSSVMTNKCILQVLDAVKVSSVLLHSRTPAVRG